MKTFLKVCFASLVLLALAKAPGSAFFGQEPNSLTPSGLNFTTLTSSGVVFNRAGVVYLIKTSTGNDVDFVVPIDTVAYVPAGGTEFGAYVSSSIVGPNVFFSSSAGTATSAYGFNWPGDYRPYGVTVANGFYLWFSAGPAAAGGNTRGNHVTVYWSK